MSGTDMLADIRERLRRKSIYEVRPIARVVGVQCPTDGKKDRLIEDIIAIASCKIAPAPRSARGAPPKSTDFDEALVADIRECIKLYSAKLSENGVAFNDTVVSDNSEERPCSGILEVGRFAVLRAKGFAASDDDVFVADTIINRFGLKEGDRVDGICRRKTEKEIAGLVAVTYINGFTPDSLRRGDFENLTPVYPDKRLRLGVRKEDILTRMADMFAPVGLGQRAVISVPADLGRTTLLRQIAAAICGNEMLKPIFFLVSAAPEDFTCVKSFAEGAEVFFTPLSARPDENVSASEFVIRRCKRLAESGANVVLIVDGASRLRNSAVPLISSALNAAEGGSLTIIATVSAEGEYSSEFSPELLSAANMRLIIRSAASDVPHIDVAKSFTLHRELLQSPREMAAADGLRARCASAEGLKEVQKLFKETENNEQIIGCDG